jgi:hypothetical protein
LIGQKRCCHIFLGAPEIYSDSTDADSVKDAQQMWLDRIDEEVRDREANKNAAPKIGKHRDHGLPGGLPPSDSETDDEDNETRARFMLWMFSQGSDGAVPVTARRAKRENGGLGEDPPGSTMNLRGMKMYRTRKMRTTSQIRRAKNCQLYEYLSSHDNGHMFERTELQK